MKKIKIGVAETENGIDLFAFEGMTDNIIMVTSNQEVKIDELKRVFLLDSKELINKIEKNSYDDPIPGIIDKLESKLEEEIDQYNDYDQLEISSEWQRKAYQDILSWINRQKEKGMN